MSHRLFQFVNLISCLGFLLSACSNQSADKMALDALNLNDTTQWILLQDLPISAQQRLVIAQSNDSTDCHMCSPKVAFVLMTQQASSESWSVASVKKDVSLLGSWGKVPEFEILRSGNNAFAACQSSYTSQGIEESQIGVFNVVPCMLGSIALHYNYISSSETVLSEPIAQQSFENLPKIKTYWPSVTTKKMNWGLDSSNSALRIYSTAKNTTLIHPTTETLTWTKELTPESVSFQFKDCRWVK
jgi:hypothetical protein